MEKEKLRPRIKLVVIGGSSGSLKILLYLLKNIRPGFPVPVLIVVHRNSHHESLLPELLSSRTDLTVKEAEEKEPVLPGYMYVAPADYHLLIESDEFLSLDYSEKINYSRPSIDVTFRSAAEVYKEHLIGILLSGANSDGAEGMEEIKRHNGITIVQDPMEADTDYMPRQAILRSAPDYILQSNDIAALLNTL